MHLAPTPGHCPSFSAVAWGMVQMRTASTTAHKQTCDQREAARERHLARAWLVGCAISRAAFLRTRSLGSPSRHSLTAGYSSCRSAITSIRNYMQWDVQTPRDHRMISRNITISTLTDPVRHRLRHDNDAHTTTTRLPGMASPAAHGFQIDGPLGGLTEQTHAPNTLCRTAASNTINVQLSLLDLFCAVLHVILNLALKF